MKKIFFYAFLFSPSWALSQVYNPSYKTSLSVTNDSNQTFSNYQVLLLFNTAIPVSLGHMKSDGSDIRFSADSCNPTSFFNYWIESNMNSDSTKIWISIPNLPSYSNTTALMWYGDSLANAMSTFNSVFPNAFISGGNDTTLSGLLGYDWFQLDNGDTIQTQSNIALQINSRVIIVKGVIQGTGMGYAAPVSIGNGNGPGGGGMSNNAGAGGGAYATLGGTGGYDVGDSPGSGGLMYGDAHDYSFFMGSSGGSTDNARGGNGGGLVSLVAEYITIENKIEVNGENGVGLIGRCGGGGSGGTIFLSGNNVRISSTSILNARGGNGGTGVSAANDGGGGGSGGRIKIFHGINSNNAGSYSLFGGSGGLYGSAGFGTDGGLGSYFDSTITFPMIFISSIGSEMALVADIIGLDSVYCLNKDSVLLDAVPPGGVFSGAGVAGNYFFPLVAGVGSHIITYFYSDPMGCGNLYDTSAIQVLNIPTFPMATNNGPLCEGSPLNLSSSDTSAAHAWTGPHGFSSTNQFPVIPSVGPVNGGNYTVIITLTSGCTSSATTNLIVHPTPAVSASNNGPVCITDDLFFVATGGIDYNWNGPNGFNSVVQSPVLNNTQFPAQGIYTVTITGIGGCTTTATTEVMVNGCYDDLEVHNDPNIRVYPNPTFHQIWFDLPVDNFNGEMEITLYDVSGKKILQQQISSNQARPSIDIGHLASGNYFLTITKGALTNHFKIIKQ